VGVFAYLWVDASFLKRPEAGIFHYLKKAHNHGSPSKTSSIMGISVLIGILHEVRWKETHLQRLYDMPTTSRIG
jgi:hypothetical protein